ncbi:uncharacterized protein N7529_008974 [Penicillium soppii]|uniref:uncharacterized protein n=1 Tax=Penicillium soppii TaxID=69789 RepID=UPI0025495692|nr:uncharacterized protein N7529_008974 [Penicillium soppii]KAJ5861664.1 hypothetical protein N7529_008974 [Penicillium soppii]
MRSTAFIALFLLTPALAIPQATSVAYSGSSSSSDSSDSSGSSDSSDSSDTIASDPIPADYISVLETAVPASWEYEMMNSASVAAVVSDAAAGIFPSWYNDLPASIKAIVTSLGGFDANMVGATGSMTATVSPNSGPATETAVATAVTGSTGSAATETQASTTSGAASSTKLTASTSVHSTGGAPIATGGVALSVAGAAGLLGLALAL